MADPHGGNVLFPRASLGPCGFLTAGSRERDVDGPETGQCPFADFFLVQRLLEPRCSGRSGKESQDHVLEAALSLWMLIMETFYLLMPTEHVQNQSSHITVINNTLKN